MDAEAPHAPTLADLIREFRDRTGESYERIAKRADLQKAHVFKMAKYDMKALPTELTLRKLAVGLQLPASVVYDAALASVGIVGGTPPAGEPRSARLDTLVTLASGLDDEDQSLLIGIAGLLGSRRPAGDTKG